MILADTSVWIDFLRTGTPILGDLLSQNEVVMHPFVVGELACGRLEHRTLLLTLLQNLPQTPVASSAEILHFIEQNHLPGGGLGLVDVHLLASARLQPGTRLMTLDKALSRAARSLGLLTK